MLLNTCKILLGYLASLTLIQVLKSMFGKCYLANKLLNLTCVFPLLGCGGNENNFQSIDECVNTCGGSEPNVEPLCAQTQCDDREARLYRAKGCQAVIEKGECCPSKWDCSRWEERMQRKRTLSDQPQVPQWKVLQDW